MSEKKILTLEDREDFNKPKGIYMPRPLKLELLVEAGKRQVAGELGPNLGPFPINEIIYEAIADEFGFEFERATKIEPAEQARILLNRMPKKLWESVREECAKTGRPENQIIVDAIEKKLARSK